MEVSYAILSTLARLDCNQLKDTLLDREATRPQPLGRIDPRGRNIAKLNLKYPYFVPPLLLPPSYRDQ